jgi:hypothetical protein
MPCPCAGKNCGKKNQIDPSNINVSEFLQLNEKIGYYLRSEFLPQSWNSEMME